MKPTNPYTTLEVPRTATNEVIKAKYRQLASRFHPDKEGGDEVKFRALAEAYEILGDPIKRLAYDESQSQAMVENLKTTATNLVAEYFETLHDGPTRS